MPGNTLNECRMRLARATRDARKNPTDPGLQADLARARAEYVEARALYRVHAAIDGAPLSLTARRKIIDAVLDA